MTEVVQFLVLQLVLEKPGILLREIQAEVKQVAGLDLALCQFVHDQDETGRDRRNLFRRYAYSWRGKPMRALKLLIRGQHLSAIAFMSVQGLLDVKVVKGGVDGDVFYDYVQNTLLPHLMPFNGTNPHSAQDS